MRLLSRLDVVGVTLLILVAVAFFAARSEQIADPRPTNVLPSGLAGLTELLRADGFDVAVEISDGPSAPSDRLVVACFVVGEGFLDRVRLADERSERSVKSHLDKGGNVLALLFEPDFVTATSAAGVAILDDGRKVSTGRLLDKDLSFADEEPMRRIHTIQPGDFVTAHGVGQGTLVTVRNAIGATNRFLKREDNAEVVLDVIRKTSGSSKKVVFFLATLGMGQSRGIAGSIGRWADALQWQMFIVLGAIAWTVSRRFGLPEDVGGVQRGARQLSDTLAEVLRGGRKRPFAARLIADQALRTTRAKLRLPPSATIEDILKRSDRETKEAYGRVLSASEERGPDATLEALGRLLAKIGLK